MLLFVLVVLLLLLLLSLYTTAITAAAPPNLTTWCAMNKCSVVLLVVVNLHRKVLVQLAIQFTQMRIGVNTVA
jgi:hypothetical protein